MSATVIWATFGVVLILAEVFTSTFVLLFFGTAALLVSLVKAFGLDNLPLEIGIFGVLGIALTAIMRKKIMLSLGHRTETYRADESVMLEMDIGPGETTTIFYQGTDWTAVNDSQETLAKGKRAKIVRTEGVRLFLKAGG